MVITQLLLVVYMGLLDVVLLCIGVIESLMCNNQGTAVSFAIVRKRALYTQIALVHGGQGVPDAMVKSKG